MHVCYLLGLRVKMVGRVAGLGIEGLIRLEFAVHRVWVLGSI